MNEKCYRVTREDGEDLGTFDRRDEAERIAEYDAQDRGYTLLWMKTFGRTLGKPSTSGRGVLGYTIEDVPM